ncbi:MAG: hypothetical protein JNN07_26005 [Verrucomicrobiales bacterium]|nr:hypothetical protein [Verrucomicrobiales bacterium]
MFNPVRTRRRVRAMLGLGLATAALTWGNIIFAVTADTGAGKLYWITVVVLCLWAVGSAVQEVAVTILWMKIRRARALWFLERPDPDGSPSPEESPSEDPHLIF